MKAYLSLIRVNLKLATRERIVIFFNYVFPLIFFFIFGQMMRAEQGGVITRIVTMVLVIGILGNGLFGGGIRAVQERELNILRRFKVTPISPMPMLAASIVTGWVLYLPAVILTVLLAHFVYGMPFPERWLSLLALVSVGVIAFRGIGLIIAAVANTSQESQILVQLVYMPMLFLTGTTFPITFLPDWAQTLSHYLPATYLVNGLQGILIRGETVAQNWEGVLALLLTTALSVFLSAQLFRWEKEEKLRASAKLWLLAMVFPSLLLGGYYTYTREQTSKAKVLFREMVRGRTVLIRNARIYPGDGRVIEAGAVLVRSGRIAQVFEGPAPEADALKAEAIEAAGKTVLPGLIDARIYLARPGGDYPGEYRPLDAMARALSAYLYCGITAVRSAGDPPEAARLQREVAAGERLGAQLFLADAAGGRESAYFIPTLSADEAAAHLARADASLLSRSLVEQVGPPELFRATRKAVASPEWRARGRDAGELERAKQNLLRAFRSGATLVAGSGAGNPLVIHGPTVQHELALWVQAGIPATAALQAATANAARYLGAAARIGLVRAGYDADLLVVDGNPIADIAALERISLVFYKGERIGRAGLFEEE